jgi:hypothetical protein
MAERTDDAILKEIRDRYDVAQSAWDDIRTEADKDMRFVGGDPWSDADRRARAAAARPCLSMDELHQYYNQAVNDVRANPLGMKFSPVGGGASDDGAQFYQDKAREIEYRSHAQQAYTGAFQDCVHRSFGWAKWVTKWVDDDDADLWRQELWIEPVPNPNAITPDPYFLRPDASDLRYLFEEESVPYTEFVRDHPDAETKGFTTEGQMIAPRWMRENGVTVANYWTVETTRKTIKAKKPSGEMVTREKDTRVVWCYQTNGVEILKKTRWPGKYIPFSACLGMVLWTNDGGVTKRTLLSMTRLARDPQMLYAYYRSCEAELVGMTPKFPYFFYEGTLDAAQLELLAKSLHEPVAGISVKPSPDGVLPGVVLGLPQRQPYEPPIAALEMGAESTRRGIQAAMGTSPLPTEAQRRNQKSGVALEQIESSQQKGNYHFKDHYIDFITHMAVMGEDLMDQVYDTAADIAVRRDDETSATVRVNDPDDPKSVQTKGHYLVTVSSGPSSESTRKAAEDFTDKLAGIPQVFSLIAPELVRMKQLGPDGDRIAEILEMARPPQVQQMLAAKKQGEEPDPQQLMLLLQQSQQQIAEAEQLMNQLKQDIDTQAAKQQADIRKAEIDRDTRIEVQRMQDATSIAVAQINASTKIGMARDEAQMKAIAIDATAQEAEASRQHESEMGQMSHQQTLEQQDAAGQQALTQQREGAALNGGETEIGSPAGEDGEDEPQMVRMVAPTGEEADVPAEVVSLAEKHGAKVARKKKARKAKA